MATTNVGLCSMPGRRQACAQEASQGSQTFNDEEVGGRLDPLADATGPMAERRLSWPLGDGREGVLRRNKTRERARRKYDGPVYGLSGCLASPSIASGAALGQHRSTQCKMPRSSDEEQLRVERIW